MTCPVVKAILEIRGAGIYVDGAEESTDRLIQTSSQTRVCDNMVFYIMTRKMELARFELMRPDILQCHSKVLKMFAHVINKTYGEIYMHLIAILGEKRLLCDQFSITVELLEKLENHIEQKIMTLGRHGHTINISLPCALLPPCADQLILYNTQILMDSVNSLVDFVNNIDINSLLTTPIISKLHHLPEFTRHIDMDAIVEPVADELPVSEYITEMKRVLDEELIVADYVSEIENYQTAAINRLNDIYNICKNIDARL